MYTAGHEIPRLWAVNLGRSRISTRRQTGGVPR